MLFKVIVHSAKGNKFIGSKIKNMVKNIIIVVLAVCLTGMAMLYSFMPRIVLVKGDCVVVKDTIYKSDTVFIAQVTDTKPGISGKKIIPPPEPKKEKDTANPYKDVNLSYKIIPSENNTFGYEILMDGRLYIHQPNIPGLPGISGFVAKETAIEVADFVISKIRKNEMPPSVSVADLKKMDALR